MQFCCQCESTGLCISDSSLKNTREAALGCWKCMSFACTYISVTSTELQTAKFWPDCNSCFLERSSEVIITEWLDFDENISFFFFKGNSMKKYAACLTNGETDVIIVFHSKMTQHSNDKTGAPWSKAVIVCIHRVKCETSDLYSMINRNETKMYSHWLDVFQIIQMLISIASH